MPTPPTAILPFWSKSTLRTRHRLSVATGAQTWGERGTRGRLHGLCIVVEAHYMKGLPVLFDVCVEPPVEVGICFFLPPSLSPDWPWFLQRDKHTASRNYILWPSHKD